MRILRKAAVGAMLLALLAWPEPHKAQSATPPGRIEEQMGIYMQGQKVGTSRLILEPLSETHPLYAEGMRHRLLETLSMQGIRTETEGHFQEDFSLGRFRFQFEGGGLAGGDLRCSGQVKGATLQVTVESEGTSTERNFPLEQPCYLSSAAHLPALLQGLEARAEFSWLIFDPMSQSLAPMTFLVEARTLREALGQTYEVAQVVMTYQGIEQTSWMTDTGLRLRDEAFDGRIVAEIETGEEAQQTVSLLGPGSGASEFMMGLIDDFKVELEGSIPHPRQCRRLLLEVSGIGPGDLVADGYWQRLVGKDSKQEAPADAFQIEIGLQPSAAPAGDLTAYLAAGFLVQSNAPAIVEQATQIVEGLTTNREKTRQLCRWVYDQVDRSAPRITIPSAVEVLNSRKGDCNEHATLFAALARAAGVPTKICVGAMYAEGAFFYHAWNEVYLEEGGWMPVDTTLNQIPADATHLKLAEGELDQQIGVLKVVGKLRLKVVASESGR